MEKCDKGYGKDCFTCEKVKDYFHVAVTGAAMDAQMLREFGERNLSIKCPSQEGYLVLKLNKEQIKDMSCGRLEEITEESATSGLLKVRKHILPYIAKHSDEIITEVMKEPQF